MDGELLHEVIGSAPEEDLVDVLVSEANSVGEPMRAVRSGPWKLIEGPEGDELYNLIMDPGETMNLVSQSPDIARELSYFLPGRQRPAGAPKFSLDETTRRRLDGEEGLVPADGAALPLPEGEATPPATTPGAPGTLPPPSGL